MKAQMIWILMVAATLGAAIPARAASPKRAAAPKPEAVIPDPGEQLGDDFERVVTALRQRPTAGSAPGRTSGYAALLAMFDLQESARRVVDRGLGHDVTTLQKHELRAVLADFMSGVVRRIADLFRLADDDGLEPYASHRVAFRQSFNDGREAVVHAALPGTGGREIPTTLWMVRRGARWLVYDIRLNDDGLVDSYQAQCAAILRRSSYTALLQRLRRNGGVLDVDTPAAAFVRPAGSPSRPAVPARAAASPAMSP